MDDFWSSKTHTWEGHSQENKSFFRSGFQCVNECQIKVNTKKQEMKSGKEDVRKHHHKGQSIQIPKNMEKNKQMRGEIGSFKPKPCFKSAEWSF